MRRDMAHRAGRSVRDAPGSPRRPVGRPGSPTPRRATPARTLDARGPRRFLGPAILAALGVVVLVAALSAPRTASAGPQGAVAAITSAPAAEPAGAAAVADAAPPACADGEELAPDQGLDDWASTILDTRFMLSPDYAPTRLVSIHEAGLVGRGTIRDVVIPDLRALGDAARSAGVTISVDSAYRSFGQQGGSYTSYLKGYGEAAARLTVARPGHSEHQLGTTIDFAGDLDWLAANAPAFGFVMSYPDDRSPDHTCYRYEAWHFRYVGRERAALVEQSGLSLREWLWEHRP